VKVVVVEYCLLKKTRVLFRNNRIEIIIACTVLYVNQYCTILGVGCSEFHVFVTQKYDVFVVSTFFTAIDCIRNTYDVFIVNGLICLNNLYFRCVVYLSHLIRLVGSFTLRTYRTGTFASVKSCSLNNVQKISCFCKLFYVVI
jgi:hypothetical protein